MAGSWTPGPWEARGRFILAAGVCDTLAGHVFGPVARVERLKETDEEGRSWWASGDAGATARLIAQAPTMADYIQRKADGGDDEARDIMERINGE